MVDLTEELRKPPRVNRTVMAVGTVICAFVAIIVGLIFGAWTIFQPYPQPSIGPVSLYVVAAFGCCLAAGRAIGLRQSIMKRGYSDPGWITPGVLVVLAAGCMAIWMASLAATGHIPEASVKHSVAPAVALPPVNAKQQVVSVPCLNGDYRQCAVEMRDLANDQVTHYGNDKFFCNSFRTGLDANPRAYARCSKKLWGPNGSKALYQRDAATACEAAAANAAQLPGDASNSRYRCEQSVLDFARSGDHTAASDPPGI
jgi:hypothetical protein